MSAVSSGDTSQSSELRSTPFDGINSDAQRSVVSPGSSISQHSLPKDATAKRGVSKRRALDVWSYSRAPTGLEEKKDKFNHKYWYCGLKNGQCDYEGTTTLRNARTHLMNAHSILSVEDESAKKRAIQQSIKSVMSKQARAHQEHLNSKARQTLREALDSRSVQRALVRLIIRRGLPHRLIEWEEFHAYSMALNSESQSVLLHSHSSVPRRISSSFRHHRRTIKRMLQAAISKIHICTDTWTSPAGHKKEYQAINAHFVDEDGVKRKALIALPELLWGHGGEHCALHIFETLQFYEITGRLGAVTSDNASTMDKMCRDIEEHLASIGIEWSALTYRLRCLGHVLNLPVQAFLFSKDSNAVEFAIQHAQQSNQPLDEAIADLSKDADGGWQRVTPLLKLKEFTHALRSNRNYNRFLALAGKMIHLRNETRWNTWTTMIEDAFQLRPYVNQFIAENRTLHHLELSVRDWQLLDDTRQFLMPFKEACRECEGDNVTLDQMLTSMDILVAHFEASRAKHANNAQLLGSITTAWYVLDKYYALSDSTPLYVSALLLHPEYRKAYLTNNWQPSWISQALRGAKAFWRTEYAKLEVDSESSRRSLSPDEAPLPSAEEPSFFQLQKQRLHRQHLATDDEFERFVEGQQLSPSSPLHWWLEPTQRRTYPRLSRMAIDVLSAPVMSAESERVWSMAKKTISVDRRNLSSEMLEQSELQKSWIHHCLVEEDFGSDSEAGNEEEEEEGKEEAIMALAALASPQ